MNKVKILASLIKFFSTFNHVKRDVKGDTHKGERKNEESKYIK